MLKITKTALMEEALKKYSSWKIEEAIHCKVEVKLKNWNAFWDWLISNFNLSNKWKKTKADKIRTEIRSLLLNRKVDDRRFYWDTSSDNIKSIKISLKFK